MDPLPRVLMLSSLWPPRVLGGAETYAARLAERLRARGCEVGVVTLGVTGPGIVGTVPAWPYALDRFEGQPAHRRVLFHLRDLYNPGTRRTLARVFREFAPDVVHSHSVSGLSTEALSYPSAHGIAHVHTIHDYWLLCQRALMVRGTGESCSDLCGKCALIAGFRRFALRRHAPDVVLAVSQAVAREHERNPRLMARLRVLPNPVEASGPVAPRRPPAQPPVFGYLGRLTTVKGVHTLLDAFVHGAPAGSRLLVAGDGPLRPQVDAAGPTVTALGWLDEARKEEFFRTIDCLVVPSEWRDPAPLVINEARARRLPVIGARIGGIPELLPPGSEPLLFTSGSVMELQERLARFAASPAGFVPAGPGEVLDWDAHVAGVLAAYTEARQRRQKERP